MAASRRFLLFSGHNDRAVVALCRYFQQAQLPFVIVAAGPDDAIHRTDWRGHVVANRIDRQVDVAWIRLLADSLGGTLVYCPTTEFINDALLAHPEAWDGHALDVGLPSPEVYRELTSKSRSQALMTALSSSLKLPVLQDIAAPRVPCVLKPVRNVAGGKVLYPLLCRTQQELEQALSSIDRRAYFAQDFITGQSLYLCGYLCRDGRHASFWQTNLMQQGGGKSIVLARAGVNPGLDEGELFEGLHRRGYHGPFMMEVIQSEQGDLHYIEVNPRFWGPLQLALDVCPQMFHLFAQDRGFDPVVVPALTADPQQAWYAWAHGARQPGCVLHPAGRMLDAAQIEHLLAAHDVYARPDTRALHACH
ncbi:MAG: hypothetical protein QM742_11200 [Aquabacterium sp.]